MEKGWLGACPAVIFHFINFSFSTQKYFHFGVLWKVHSCFEGICYMKVKRSSGTPLHPVSLQRMGELWMDALIVGMLFDKLFQDTLR